MVLHIIEFQYMRIYIYLHLDTVLRIYFDIAYDDMHDMHVLLGQISHENIVSILCMRV